MLMRSRLHREVSWAMTQHAWAVLQADPRVPAWFDAVAVFLSKPAEERAGHRRLTDEPLRVLQSAAQAFLDSQPDVPPSINVSADLRVSRDAVIEWFATGWPAGLPALAPYRSPSWSAQARVSRRR